MDAHALAEARSLALHRVIAMRLREDPTLVARAGERVTRWTAAGALVPEYARRWRELLAQPLESLAAMLIADTEDARALRQTTPFSFVVSPRDRWRIWRETKAEPR